MSFDAAREEIVRLKKAYPLQEFEVFASVGSVSVDIEVSVKIEAPSLDQPIPFRKARL